MGWARDIINFFKQFYDVAFASRVLLPVPRLPVEALWAPEIARYVTMWSFFVFPLFDNW